jgi:hypothetical protein
MSNPLSVRRVKVQTIKADGTPEGEPSYGVLASDDYASDFNDTFDSLEELNAEIEASGCILNLVDRDKFAGADSKRIGKDNFYGNNWKVD